MARSGVAVTARRSLLDAPTSAPAGVPVLALGFRPFFLLAGGLGALLVPLWLLAFFGQIELPTRFYGPTWHGHEMVFGFAAAVLAGFLLTAARNWTGQQTATGRVLGALVALFVLGRVVVLFSARLPPMLVAAVDVAFLPAVAAALAVPIIRKRNWRNLGFVPLLLTLSAANVLFHAAPLHASVALRVALDVILVIVILMGGRVIPSFTANALRVEVRKTPVLDALSLGAMAAVTLLELSPVPRIAGAMAIVAGVANGARMTAWHPLRTRKQPILWVLHVGYAWLALGLVLKGVAAFVPSWISTAPMHALAVGALSVLILGMMTRVSLGHTGRMLVVPSSIAVAYEVLVVTAVLRAVGPLVAPSAYRVLLIASGVGWMVAFAIFTLVYLPILIARRTDGKAG